MDFSFFKPVLGETFHFCVPIFAGIMWRPPFVCIIVLEHAHYYLKEPVDFERSSCVRVKSQLVKSDTRCNDHRCWRFHSLAAARLSSIDLTVAPNSAFYGATLTQKQKETNRRVRVSAASL